MKRSRDFASVPGPVYLTVICTVLLALTPLIAWAFSLSQILMLLLVPAATVITKVIAGETKFWLSSWAREKGRGRRPGGQI